MTILEAINYRNNQNAGKTFKVSKNWVMVKNNFDKKFSDHSNIELFIENTEHSIKMLNSNENAKKTVEFLISVGLEIDNKSVYGSTYFYTKKGHIRVSNHHYTSELYNDPELNLCSYEKNGFEKMIAEFKIFINQL